MKEQSHKDEMSAAVRCDFERLRERGVSVTLAPRETAPPEPKPVTREAKPAAPKRVEKKVDQGSLF